MTGSELRILYTNWRGETGLRRIEPIRLEFGSNEFHKEPQWLMIARDVEKNTERSFALKDIHWIGGPEATPPHQR